MWVCFPEEKIQRMQRLKICLFQEHFSNPRELSSYTTRSAVYCTGFTWWLASKMGEWPSTQIKRERESERERGENDCKLRLAFQTFSPVKTLTSSIVCVPGRGLSELCISWVSLDVIVALLNIHGWICGINSLVNWQRTSKACPWVSHLHLHFWKTVY